MKLLTILITFFSMSLAYAGADNYLCKFNDSSDQTVLFKKLNDLPVDPSEEGVDYKARYNVRIQTSELPFPSVNLEGVATLGDVHFYFESDDKTVTSDMFTDDNDGTLTQDGQERIFSECIVLNPKK